MIRLLNTSLIFSLAIFIVSCKKNRIDDNPANYKLSRVEYYDTTGKLTGNFKNLSYFNGALHQIELISGNSQELVYQNNKLVVINNRLLGVPFPITSLHFKYSSTDQIEQIVTTTGGQFAHPKPDTITFTWSGSRIQKAVSATYNQTGKKIFEEEINYFYAGDNIIKCVFQGNYNGYTAGPIYWKDSAVFEYDVLNNRFAENGISFFLQEFSLINRFRQLPLRVSYDPYIDPFWFDPVFFPFILSRNNVVKMKSNGGQTTQQYNYIMGTGLAAEKLSEIRINDRLVSRYYYSRVK